jgi:serine phosphatase RsbU (regulator of sigma subunit)
MKRLLLLTVFLLSKLLAVGQNTDSVIVFNSEKELLNIGKYVYLFEDKEGNLTIEDIQKPEYQQKFKKSEQEIPNFNTTSSKIWVKFIVLNQTDEKNYLEVAQAMAWYLDFYKPDSTGKPVLATQTGMERPMSNREIDNNFFLFELSKGDKVSTYYFSIQSEFGLNIPLTLGTLERLYETRYPYILLLGMFSGLMLIMFFYNLFVYFSVRDRMYLLYSVYLISNVFSSNFVSGNYGYKWNIISYFHNYLMAYTVLNSYITMLFVFNLLKVDSKSTFFKGMVSCLAISMFCGMINLITGHYILVFNIMQLLAVLTCFYIFFYGLSEYKKGNVYAKFIIFGYSLYLFAIIVLVSRNFGLLPSNFFTINSLVFGTSLEILIFSLALGERINRMRKEKEISQNALLAQTQENERMVREQNLVLEQKVAIRTEELQQTNEELNTTLDTISKQRDDIVSSINYALRIQKAIIPKEAELQKHLDCFVFFRPRDIVSGDFYWFAQKEKCKVLAVADCTGHGVSGAFMTMIGNNILNQLVHDYEIYEPSEILSKMQLLLKKVLAQSGEDVKDGMDIAIVKIENEVLTYSGAMNPIYYVQNQEFTEIKADKIPISGVSDKVVTYQKNEISIPTPTTFYLTTDGYQDQFGGDKYRKFMVRNLKKLLFEISHNSLEEQKNILINTFDQWKAAYKQTDDVLIVGIKI